MISVKGIIVIAPSLGFGGILLYSIYAQRASLNTTDSSLSLPFVTCYQSSRFRSVHHPRHPAALPLGASMLLLGAASSSPNPFLFRRWSRSRAAAASFLPGAASSPWPVVAPLRRVPDRRSRLPFAFIKQQQPSRRRPLPLFHS